MLMSNRHASSTNPLSIQQRLYVAFEDRTADMNEALQQTLSNCNMFHATFTPVVAVDHKQGQKLY